MRESAYLNKITFNKQVVQIDSTELRNPALLIVCREAMNGNKYSLHAVIKMPACRQTGWILAVDK